MLSFNVIVSGGQIAREIMDDDEELAEFLKELCEHDAEYFSSVADYLYEAEAHRVSKFLRRFAEVIEGGK